MSVFQLRTGAALKISRRPADLSISFFLVVLVFFLSMRGYFCREIFLSRLGCSIIGGGGRKTSSVVDVLDIREIVWVKMHGFVRVARKSWAG